MTGDDFREGLRALGCSAAAFSRVCGVGERVAQRWAGASGGVTVPPGAAALLRLALANKRRMPWRDMAALCREEAARLEAAPAEVSHVAR